jgi:hypothetical protein
MAMAKSRATKNIPSLGTKIQVEKGVPIPDGEAPRENYPWGEMELGDSFFLPGDPDRMFDRLSRTARERRRRYGGRFLIRRVAGGARVWRIE